MSITPKEGWMIDPGNSNGVVQISAINPATGAAYGAPTAVDGKIVNPAPPIAPTPAITMPAKSGDGAVSSADIANGAAKNTATNAAASALTPPTVDLQPQIDSFIKSSNDRLNLSQSALKGSFDAALASSNQQYAGLFAALETNHRNASQAGNALASQLNPYADPRIASTTAGYIKTIDDKYAAQAESLKGQMNAAQAQLQAGYYENYVKLVNDAQEKQQTFTTDMQKFGLDIYNSMKQAAQFDKSNEIQNKTLDATISSRASDDFRSYLSTLSGSPALQSDVESYLKDGKITEGLMPIVKKGQEAGLSPSEAISIFKYQTDSVRKQQALDDYRNQQLTLSQDRLTAATEKQTNATRAIATTNAVLAAQSDMRARGIDPGSAEWATGVASATGASSKGLSAPQVSKYTQMGVLANQLTGIKGAIDKTNDKDPIWTTLQTYAGRDVSSVTDSDMAALNAKLTSLSGVIGKTFYGESGNLSNSDVQRVLGALPTGAGTPELRKALYAGLLTVARDNAITTLESDAQGGYQVATYVDSVQRIANITKDAMAAVAPSKKPANTGAFDYATWQKQNFPTK